MALDLCLGYASLSALQRDYETDLRKGRAFIAGATGPGQRERCRLVIVHPDTGHTFAVQAEVVWVKSDAPGIGVGVELRDFGEAERAALRAFVEEPTPAAEPRGVEEEPAPHAPDRDPGPRNI